MPKAFAMRISDMEQPINQTACTYYRLQIKSKTFRGLTTSKKVLNWRKNVAFLAVFVVKPGGE